MVTSAPTAPVLDDTGHAAAERLTRGSWFRLVGAAIVLWLGLSAIGIALWRGPARAPVVQGDVPGSEGFVPRPPPPLDPPTPHRAPASPTITAVPPTAGGAGVVPPGL